MKIEMKQYTAKKCASGDEKMEVIYLVKNIYGEPVGKVTVRDRFIGFETFGDQSFSMNEESHQAVINKVFQDFEC